MDLELRHLRIVCAVAEAGSVTKAAAALGLAQPAVTAQLRRIERSLGGELFERGRHGVTPTRLGELVLTRAKVLLPAARELHEDALKLAASVRAQHGPPTRLRIGTIGGPYLAAMVRLIEKHEPDIEVVLSASFRWLELLEQLRSDRLDYAAIGCCGEHGLPTDPDLVTRMVAVEPVCVMVAENHPSASLAEVPLRVLADEHWAWLPGDGCLEECFVAACVREGFHPRTGYESDASTCIEMSRTGRAVTLCLPTRRAPGVVVRPIARAPLRWVHAMVWRAEEASESLSASLLPAAAAAYAEVVAEAPEYAAWLAEHPTFGVVPEVGENLPARPS
ncbi:MAG TPA: LysR family transcriptional regulator [Micromonosporaceae bacterium]